MVTGTGDSWWMTSRRTHSPVSTLADDLDLKVVDAAGGGDGLCGTHRGGVFVVLAMACERKQSKWISVENNAIETPVEKKRLW